jgi:hypothetical protein
MTGEAMELPLAETLEAVRSAHFDADGTVCDYAALHASREHGRLAACLSGLDSFDPKRVRLGAQTAFWINVFNAGVLRDAAELELLSGERDREAFFERARLKVSGQPFSLDDIYHGLLRGNLPKHGHLRSPMSRSDPRLAYMPIAFDERMHLALHTAARSSPALWVFKGGKLDVQLEEATQSYIQRTARVEREGARVVAPKLLQWYAQDFGGENGVRAFVLSRLDDASVDLAERHRGREKLKYADFDWRLNRR